MFSGGDQLKTLISRAGTLGLGLLVATLFGKMFTFGVSGLAFTCLLAAVPGALAAAPFAMVLMAAFLTQLGALQTAPVLIAVVTAFLTMDGVKYLLASRKQASAAETTQRSG